MLGLQGLKPLFLFGVALSRLKPQPTERSNSMWSYALTQKTPARCRRYQDLFGAEGAGGVYAGGADRGDGGGDQGGGED